MLGVEKIQKLTKNLVKSCICKGLRVLNDPRVRGSSAGAPPPAWRGAGALCPKIFALINGR